MVEFTTTNLAKSNTDDSDYIDLDQKASTIALFYHNMFALIKLRK